MTPLDSFPQQHKQLSALAFDYGTQRIGVAYGQSLTGTAQAVAVIRARDGVPDWGNRMFSSSACLTTSMAARALSCCAL